MADAFRFRSWEPTYFTYSKDEFMRYIRRLEAEVRRLEGFCPCSYCPASNWDIKKRGHDEQPNGL